MLRRLKSAGLERYAQTVGELGFGMLNAFKLLTEEQLVCFIPDVQHLNSALILVDAVKKNKPYPVAVIYIILYIYRYI